MTRQLTFSEARTQGEAQGQACLEKTRQTLLTWLEDAFRFLEHYIFAMRGQGPWSGETATTFVLTRIEAPHDQRSFGALFSKAARAGLVKRSSEVFERAHGHGTKTLGWISL